MGGESPQLGSPRRRSALTVPLRAALSLLALAALAAAGFYLWTATSQSVATLNFVDARFSRPVRAREAARAHYGADPRQRVVVFVPVGAREPPLVVFIHGGGWETGDPDDYTFVARALAQRGYAPALVGYRLREQGRFPAMLDDSAAAVKWLLAHRARLGVRTDRLVLAGHSAGAYNAVMLALDRTWLGRAGVPEGAVKGVIGLAGPYDFYPFDTRNLRTVFGRYARPQETQPIRFVRRAAPPMLLVTGTADITVKPRNSQALAAALRKAGARADEVRLAGVDHTGLVVRLARPFDRDRRVLDAMFPFLDAVTRMTAATPSATVQSAKG